MGVSLGASELDGWENGEAVKSPGCQEGIAALHALARPQKVAPDRQVLPEKEGGLALGFMWRDAF